MAFDKETAQTANKFYTNGKGMYMLLFDTYSVITSGNSEGPTDDVYLKTESGNPVGAEWKDAVTNEPVSLTISAGATPIPFTGLVKSPEGAISIDKGSSIELSVQPQPADTTDSITYNWSVDGAYLSYSLNNNKCIITGVAAGSTTVTVTPVVNGTADASKAVSFATTINVVIPTISIGSPDIASQKWQVGTAVSLDLVSHMSISASEGSLVFEAFECPAGITVSSSGIVSGTPAEDASGSILINVYVEGFRSDTIKSINLAYSIDAAAPTLTVSDPITPVQTWQATVAISSVNLMTLCGISTSDGSTPKFTSAYVPAGLTLSSNGILSGTPSSSTGPESFQVTVCIPGFEEETTKYIAVNYVINEAPPTLSYITTSVTMPEMTAGTEIQPYSIINACQLSASNGAAIIFSGAEELPEGLSLNNGIITGTPVSENSGSCVLYAYLQGYYNKGVNISVSYVINAAQGGGDTPSVTYLYTVSGSSRAEANGDYWQDGTMNGKGKYTNGSCDMVWIGSYWAIGPIGYNGSGAPYHSCWEDIATPISSSWSGVTVTEYAGNSGEGGGEDEGGDTPDVETSYLLVQGFSPSNFGGTGTTLDPNGKYYLEDETATGNERVWVSESGYFKIYDVSKQGSWYLDGVSTYLGEAVYPENNDNTESPYKTDGSSCDWLSMGAMISGASVTLVSSANSGGGSSSDSEDNTQTVAYLVSNDGFTGDLAKYAGTYTQTNATAAGTSAIYKNENNCYMYRHGSTWGWVFSSSEGGYPDVITYETSDDPTQATNKGYWYNESTVTEMQPGTVTLVGGEGGSSDGESGGASEGYTITSFEGVPALQANYLKTTAPSWGDSSYTYYKHETMDIYLYTTGSSTVIRGFDAYGFTSDYWFSAFAQNPCDVVNFMDENSGVMFNATITQE